MRWRETLKSFPVKILTLIKVETKEKYFSSNNASSQPTFIIFFKVEKFGKRTRTFYFLKETNILFEEILVMFRKGRKKGRERI